MQIASVVFGSSPHLWAAAICFAWAILGAVVLWMERRRR